MNGEQVLIQFKSNTGALWIEHLQRLAIGRSSSHARIQTAGQGQGGGIRASSFFLGPQKAKKTKICVDLIL
jgi:hypothetical protein